MLGSIAPSRPFQVVLYAYLNVILMHQFSCDRIEIDEKGESAPYFAIAQCIHKPTVDPHICISFSLCRPDVCHLLSALI